MLHLVDPYFCQVSKLMIQYAGGVIFYFGGVLCFAVDEDIDLEALRRSINA